MAAPQYDELRKPWIAYTIGLLTMMRPDGLSSILFTDNDGDNYERG